MYNVSLHTLNRCSGSRERHWITNGVNAHRWASYERNHERANRLIDPERLLGQAVRCEAIAISRAPRYEAGNVPVHIQIAALTLAIVSLVHQSIQSTVGEKTIYYKYTLHNSLFLYSLWRNRAEFKL